MLNSPPSPLYVVPANFFLLLPPSLPLFPPLFSLPEAKAERTQSEGRANPEWRHSVKTNPRLAISRPFSNAKIVRNNDITNFSSKKSHFSHF